MTFIANPIYDVVFKFMMEDEKVAKLLLSALLKKDIIELQMRQHEYTAMHKPVSPCSVWTSQPKSSDNDGTEHLVLIELQKTWAGYRNSSFPPVSGYALPR